ncbi:MAG TPA: c-type cytochrome biogenesis protein CcmI [Burkholderiales bacterium]|nr:c-type cytochrome biogenesis protein CcmI [Burkholderiales bacterium]
MILFWSLAAALTAAALLFLLPPLLRRRTAAPDARVAANAAIYREHLEELAADLQRGAIGKEEFERSSREIERRIVAEYAAGAPEGARHDPQRAAAIAIGLFLPLAALLAYWNLGEPRAIDAEAVRSAGAREMGELVEKLAARLEKSPDDAQGWALLGRSLSSLGQPARAARAFARALQLAPEDKDLLVDFVKSLALAGRAEFESRNFQGAIEYWERILPFAPPDSEFARSVEESIAEARTQGGIAAAPAPQAKPASAPALKKTAKAPAAAASIAGTVSLDPALAAKAQSSDTVFILARPASGARMPLAVARVTVAQLPYRFTLDDSMAMAPGATISSHAQVMVVARVSKSGSPAPQKGDIEGSIGPVAPGASGLKVVLSRLID